MHVGIDSASSLLDEMNDCRPDRGRSSASADKATERLQEKKTAGGKRGKTFTGCWTCRERHVKCDEQRPKCKRCIAGNFACQGYSTRLTWLTPMSQRVSKSNCRTRHTAEESSSIGVNVPTRGSLSGFPTLQPEPTPKRRRHTERSRPTVTTEQACQNVQPAEPRDVETIQPSEIITTVNKSALFEGVPNDTRISLDDNELVYSEQQNLDSNLWPTVNSSSWSPGVDHLQLNWYAYSQQFPNNGSAVSSFFDPMSIPRIGSPLTPFGTPSSATRERELISHWATNLADKLVPFRSPANPFLTVVSPMALEGSRTARTKSTCTVALFHAVCAISAAHQANLRACALEDDGLLLHHKQLSFHHLMQNIDRRDHDERMACLATLCLWILIHFVTGTPGAWREVTKVTRGLLEGISAETWAQSTTAALTYQSFSSSFALIQAQYLGRQESLAPLKTTLPGVDMVKSQIMPARSLELLSSFNTKLMRAHAMPSEELDQLEIEFALSTPEPSTDFDAGNAASAMVHHHRSLFYYASLLYFRGNSGRRGPEEEVQGLVARCLDHMEHLDLLQKDGSPKTWVYAVVAFEAATPELRHRTRSLFAKRMSLGIAAWNTLLLAVEEVWKRRDANFPGLDPEPWTRVLANMPELDVVLY
ncbi:hypothetical protein INS49_008967 [Diaporthe citri]|uniref:uncharacterized protein n=1 Tax=Diaporthe citri TaxID=83186 RepID=UPI001C827CA4|nr:uncharacterized protein INS49_008967 [Diaporthe citri]KAG6363864.1 hypothetical protein INS49_008967 [Diaporthe citri]